MIVSAERISALLSQPMPRVDAIINNACEFFAE